MIVGDSATLLTLLTVENHAAFDRLRKARTKYEISSALDALARAPEPWPVDPSIVELTRDARWLVRQSAICALGNAVGLGVEDALLAVSQRAEDHLDLVYVNAALGKVGSHRSLPYLTHMVFHPKEDVATSALAALQKIGGNAQQACFLEALADRRWAVKWYAMCAIETHGDAAAVDAVLKRAKQILRGRRGLKQGSRSELEATLGFLWRHRDARPDVEQLFRVFLPSRAENLTAEERAACERLAESSGLSG